MKLIIPNTGEAAKHRQIVCDTINSLSDAKAWQVDIKLYRRKRSLEQNSFLWAVPLHMISEHTGYEKEDLKDYLMGTFFGWEEFEILGQRRKRPAKGSSELTTAEFNDFLDYIERWAAQELGMVIPKPNEEV